MNATFEDLKSFFDIEMKPYWTLRRTASLNTATGEIVSTNLENENIDESWAKLEKIMSIQGDGYYVLEVRSSKNSGGHKPIFKFTKGDAVAGIGNTSTGQPAYNNTGIGTAVYNEIKAKETEINALKMQMMTMDFDRKIEALKDKKVGGLDKFLENENFVNKVAGLIDRFFSPQGATIVSGQGDTPVPADAGTGAPTTEQQDEYVRNIWRDIHIINENLPNKNIGEILEKLADMSVNNHTRFSLAISML